MGIKNRKKSWLPVNFIEQKKIEKLAQYTRLKKVCVCGTKMNTTRSQFSENLNSKKRCYMPTVI